MPGPRSSIRCSFSRGQPPRSFPEPGEVVSQARHARRVVRADAAEVEQVAGEPPLSRRVTGCRIDRLCPALRRPRGDRPAALSEARRSAHVFEALRRPLGVVREPLARDVVQGARFALARDPERCRLGLQRRTRARGTPRGDVTDRLVRRGSEVRGPHERIGVLDVHIAGAYSIGRLDERNCELAMGGLARDEEIVPAAERNPDLDDGIRIASELLGRQ